MFKMGSSIKRIFSTALDGFLLLLFLFLNNAAEWMVDVKPRC